MSRSPVFAARISRAAAFVLLTIATTVHGAVTSWLTVTSPPPGNEVILAPTQSHLLTLPGYGGTATVTNVTASGSAVVSARSAAFYPPSTFNGYAAEGLDPVGADQYVVSGSTPDQGNTAQVRFDFNGLPWGYLPAGSIFLTFDIDTFEAMREVTASLNSVPYNSPWLALQSQFDSDGVSPLTQFSAYSFIGIGYDFPPNTVNSDAPVQYFLTTQDIDQVDFIGVADLGPRGFAVSWGVPIPEPTSLGIAAFGLAAVASRRRRG